MANGGCHYVVSRWTVKSPVISGVLRKKFSVARLNVLPNVSCVNTLSLIILRRELVFRHSVCTLLKSNVYFSMSACLIRTDDDSFFPVVHLMIFHSNVTMCTCFICINFFTVCARNKIKKFFISNDRNLFLERSALTNELAYFPVRFHQNFSLE